MLPRLGVTVPEGQLRQVYRWKLFREHIAAARAEFAEEWGGTPPGRAESITKDILWQWQDRSTPREDQ